MYRVTYKDIDVNEIIKSEVKDSEIDDFIESLDENENLLLKFVTKIS